jgi:hypothetical protein
MFTFTARLEPVPRGGHYVIVPEEIAEAAGLRHGARVRGNVAGAPYRSSLMKYGGVLHLGVHKATLARAGITAPARVKVSIELDDEPLPTDVVPPDLARALRSNRAAQQAWRPLRPSLKREHVQALLSAKKPETRARRLAKMVEDLGATAPSRGRR